jgi:hypothetical protein
LSTNDLVTLTRYQTGLFTALVGLMTAKGLVSHEEVAIAIDTVERSEADELAAILFGFVAASLRPASAPSSPVKTGEGRLSLVKGGRTD